MIWTHSGSNLEFCRLYYVAVPSWTCSGYVLKWCDMACMWRCSNQKYISIQLRLIMIQKVCLKTGYLVDPVVYQSSCSIIFPSSPCCNGSLAEAACAISCRARGWSPCRELWGTGVLLWWDTSGCSRKTSPGQKRTHWPLMIPRYPKKSLLGCIWGRVLKRKETSLRFGPVIGKGVQLLRYGSKTQNWWVVANSPCDPPKCQPWAQDNAWCFTLFCSFASVLQYPIMPPLWTWG